MYTSGEYRTGGKENASFFFYNRLFMFFNDTFVFPFNNTRRLSYFTEERTHVYTRSSSSLPTPFSFFPSLESVLYSLPLIGTMSYLIGFEEWGQVQQKKETGERGRTFSATTLSSPLLEASLPLSLFVESSQVLGIQLSSAG